MDTCHNLLGRRWQYCRKMVYKGFKNTYTFEKDEKHIMLLSLKETKVIKDQSKQGLVSRAIFLYTMREAFVALALVLLEGLREKNPY